MQSSGRYLKSENGYAKYSAVITNGGALTIDFEKDAATKAVEKVQEVVEQKQTTAKTPFPVPGILAGLGAAAFFLRRR